MPVVALMVLTAFFLAACSSINSSWEETGGGYLKYTVDGGESHTIELDKDDCEPPYYGNSHSYFYLKTQLSKSSQGDQFSLMVASPSTNGKLKLVPKASVNGKTQDITWMREQYSPAAPLISDSSYIHFDEIINDSLWTANVVLYFTDCRSGVCNDSLPPVMVSGRLRYWVDPDER